MVTYCGGCQCGKIRYSISQKPIVAYCCHCTDCQRQSSSAFGMSVWFSADAFSLTSGELSVRKAQTGKGTGKIYTFCPDCGSRIYHASSDELDTFSIKGGSLDNISEITPIGHIWTRSAQPWIMAFLEDKYRHETEPDSFDILVRQFGETSR